MRRGSAPDLREAYPIRLPDRLPCIAVPLLSPNRDVVADLQPILDRVYTMGRYGRTIDYSRPADPPLAASDATWARKLLKSR